MKSSYELKSLRTKYYNLVDDLKLGLSSLREVPRELVDASNSLENSFAVNDESIDKKALQKCEDRIDDIISNLKIHISEIERAIDRLNEEIEAREIEEMGG